jgi:Cu/Ag efflux protein CusF
VDLALALGLGLGYLRWGREVARLGEELAVERARPTVGEWTALGVVRAVLPELNVVVLTHEEIGEVMPAMTMGFRMASPGLSRGLEAGDEVRFTLRGSAANPVITAIEKVR